MESFFKYKAQDDELLNQSQVLKKARQILLLSKWSPEERQSYYNELQCHTIFKSSLATYHKGLELGIEEGKEEATLNIAKKMLKMDYPIESIIEITGLSEDEINEII